MSYEHRFRIGRREAILIYIDNQALQFFQLSMSLYTESKQPHETRTRPVIVGLNAAKLSLVQIGNV